MRGLRGLDTGLPPFAVVLVAALGATVLVASAAIAVSHGGSPKHRADGTPVTPSSSSPSPSAAAVHGAAAYLVDVASVLPAYRRVPDKLAGTGPMRVADAAAIDNAGRAPTAKQEQALRALGYVGGQSRAWDDGVRTIVGYAYEWRTDNGARAFLRGVEAVHQGRHDAWRTRTPHAAGSCHREGADIVDSVVVQAGRYTFTFAVVRTGSCGEHLLAERIGRAQYDRAAGVV